MGGRFREVRSMIVGRKASSGVVLYGGEVSGSFFSIIVVLVGVSF